MTQCKKMYKLHLIYARVKVSASDEASNMYLTKLHLFQNTKNMRKSVTLVQVTCEPLRMWVLVHFTISKRMLITKITI